MSQRECVGFNWPELTVPAREPVAGVPGSVSRTTSTRARGGGRRRSLDLALLQTMAGTGRTHSRARRRQATLTLGLRLTTLRCLRRSALGLHA